MKEPATRTRRSAPAHPGERKADTQARILGAAVALFTTRGYDRTSISAIAERAGVSRATVFWHFGDKSTLFQEAFSRLLVPFIEKLRENLEHLEPRKRLFEMFNVYEQFVEGHREGIESFVRWALESESLRSSLQKPLFALHDEFRLDIRNALEELLSSREEAEELASALISQLDGNLLLDLLQPQPRARELRRAGLRRLTEIVLSR